MTPTPFLLRVGPTSKTCVSPFSQSKRPPRRPSTTPSSPNSPARFASRGVAHRAEPCVVLADRPLRRTRLAVPSTSGAATVPTISSVGCFWPQRPSSKISSTAFIGRPCLVPMFATLGCTEEKPMVMHGGPRVV